MTLDLIREIASKLPHVTEDIKWGNDLCFCIAGKMFCVTGLESGPASNEQALHLRPIWHETNGC
jgi:hypothetical protein